MKQKITLFLIAILAVIPAESREITGKVIGENQTPIDFANVVIYQDSTYVTGSITDTDGRFSINTDIVSNLTEIQI